MPAWAALQFLQIYRPQKSILEDFTSPSYCWPPPLSLSDPHSGTQILQHLTRALNAQALSLEFGSEGGLSGWSLRGSSLCLDAPYVGGLQGYTLFYILSLYAYEIANTFCCFIVISDTSFLFPTFHLGRDASYPGELVELVTSPPLAPFSGPMKPSL